MKKRTLAISLVCVAPVLFAQTTLTTPGGGSVTFCASHADYPGTKAFDQGGNGDTSRWLALKAAMPNAFVTYSFRGDTVINGYAVVGLVGVDNVKRSPKSWTLEGSSDMENWLPVDTQSNQVNWTSQQKRLFMTTITNSFQHWRFTMHEQNDVNDYVGIQELELYGYFDFTAPPIIRTLPYELPGTGAVRLNGALDNVGGAHVFIAWGDAPGNLVNTNDLGMVTGTFGLTLSNFGDFQTYWYTILAENSSGSAELPEPLHFTTRGPVFYWSKTSGGQWEDAANWKTAAGAPAVGFPNAPGDVAVLTNTTATILLGQDIRVGELHTGLASTWSAPTFTNSVPGAKLVFDNGLVPALLSHRNAYASPRFYNDWEIRNDLTINNDSASAILFYGQISGANPDLTLIKNQFRWLPVRNTVFTGSITSTGSGLFAKDGRHDLTLLGQMHSVRFGSPYSENDGGGLYGEGSLTVSGGVFTNLNTSISYLFANPNGHVILTDGVRYFPVADTTLGRVDRNSTNSTVIVTGDGTAWENKRSLSVRRSHFLVRDGARADMGAVTIDDGSRIEIAGASSLMNLNNNNLWVSYAAYTVPSNRLMVSQGGVLTNAAVKIHGQYAGGTNSFVKVFDGGRVYATLSVGQGGNQTGHSVETHAVITGEGSIWKYPSAGTVQIGPRGNGLMDIGNFVWVEKGGVFTNAAFNIGYSANTDGNKSYENHLDITDGGKVYSTLDCGIGLCLSAGANVSHVERHYARVGGGDADSLWSLGGKALRVGQSNGPGGWSIGNHLDVRPRGRVANISTLYVGTSDVNANSNNFVRLAGGSIAATAMEIKTKNGIEAVVGPDGPGKISVANKVTISAGTFVRAVKTKGALTGAHVIVQAATIADGGIALSPDTDTSMFRLVVTPTEIILHHYVPGTLMLVK